ncbi:N-6 DNA methylase [Umezawaea endophytica]|uniref:N-6 DNA methylase n=1 Tax=Umezawaea endophytica TaxID=1654476 RepID=A0A9X2VZF7_9PSEU|nr:N-6 DNA methylase [Umezawaea endophytica]MCS7484809.1 N-6 DNA methylase [Umezawaea endophytica]
MTQRSAVPVTLAEIARIAGVGRAAVSNWRRRHDTFPARIGGTDTSPQFSLAEVESWLRAQGKLHDVGNRERLWPQFDVLGDRAETGLAIAMTALNHQPRGAILVSEPKFALSQAAQRLVDQATALGEQEGARQTFEFLLSRWLDTNVRQVSSTPRPLAKLMAEIAVQVRGDSGGGPRIVLDPACGTGSLLHAAAEILSAGESGSDPMTLAGTDQEPVLAALTAARLSFVPSDSGLARGGTEMPTVDVRTGDTLRADPHANLRADLVLCNPPFNERDWGYEELATDPRWTYGLPPGTEPELAWVQHALARLAPGGTAVLVLPPAVASRKAGRRIRGALLRAGVLRSVIALPPGCAQPHSVSLHLWVLQAGESGQAPETGHSFRLIDAASTGATTAKSAQNIDWDALRSAVLTAMTVNGSLLDTDLKGGAAPPVARSITVPLIDLLDDEVDLTPARHVPAVSTGNSRVLRESWNRFSVLLGSLEQTSESLSAIGAVTDGAAESGTTTVGELIRAGALILRAGQLPPENSVRTGDVGEDGLPVLTVPDLLTGGDPGGWLPRHVVADADLLVTARDDVIVAGVTRAFSAWVELGAATVLGPQLYALRADPARLDPWFLAGCLRAPANGRQAGTHTSSSARVDVRKLQVLQLPIEEQRRYGEVFRQVSHFQHVLQDLGGLGSRLLQELSDGLSAGRLPPP